MTQTTAPSALDEAAFIRGYTTCMLWAENDQSEESGGEPLDSNYSIDDIPAEDRLEIARDCIAFIGSARALLEDAVSRDGYTSDRAGRDFWLTRQGHGAGYWDRDELDEKTPGVESLGDRLTEASKNFGEHHDGPFAEEGAVLYGRGQHTLAVQVARIRAEEAAEAAVKENLGEAMDCNRVWSAWSYKTMGPDDFNLVSEDSDRVRDIAIAALDAAQALPPGWAREDTLYAVYDAVAEALGEAYECTGHWDDWGSGGITQDSFRLVAEQDSWVDSIATATLNAIESQLTVLRSPAPEVPEALRPTPKETITPEQPQARLTSAEVADAPAPEGDGQTRRVRRRMR